MSQDKLDTPTGVAAVVDPDDPEPRWPAFVAAIAVGGLSPDGLEYYVLVDDKPQVFLIARGAVAIPRNSQAAPRLLPSTRNQLRVARSHNGCGEATRS